ncbi:MAG: IMP cyclohydrolase [Lachnospiraceae bacterium]
MTDIFDYLSARPYPGRGILLGAAPDGAPVCAYFIMGRSENSRNRVFERTPDGIRTRAFDEAKMTDPSLIIYHSHPPHGAAIPHRRERRPDGHHPRRPRRDFTAALRTRRVEPDAPQLDAAHLSLPGPGRELQALRIPATRRTATGTRCLRCFYEYERRAGTSGTSSSTYEGFGSPLPSFSAANRWRSRSPGPAAAQGLAERRSGRRWMRITASRSTSRRRARK